jgi:hypothetical protein
MATAATPTRVAGGKQPPVQIQTKQPNRIVLTTPAYRLSVSTRNGRLIDLIDRRMGAHLVSGQDGCAWGLTLSDGGAFGGCAFAGKASARFSHEWARARSTLTLRYRSGRQGSASATVTIVARPDFLDLRLSLRPGFAQPVSAVTFPADLESTTSSLSAAYTPTFLPGVRLLPGFFETPHRNVARYPSRWAFADFVAADIGRSHLALYSVNPAPSPIAPVDVGVISETAGACSGPAFCLTHAFQTWLRPGERWTSPVVRLRVGGSAERSILAYRDENGISRYPSLREKLGAKLDTLARAPLVKADPWKGLPRFDAWSESLRRLPSPSLLHPVAFQPRGHDEEYPDFLPPDERWGTSADFNRALNVARSLGQIVMPYLNVTWWDNEAPSVRELPPSLTPADIAMQTPAGDAVSEQFGEKDGYIVSPFVPYVRDRVSRLFEEWQRDVPVECLFFDQIGARVWRRDFNPSEPSPIAYEDGWIETFSRYRDRCLMSEDGWDRLADAFVGFHGGLLDMEREHRWPDEYWGEGNWEPYPLALWLLHDKVLMYQHDLYPGTFTFDPEVLLFNIAFGIVLSTKWDGASSLDNPWLSLAGRVQRALGPHYAGQALTRYRDLAKGVTESRFGDDYTVIANWNPSMPYEVDGYQVAPLGFLARDGAGRVLAGTFGDRWHGVTIPSGGRAAVGSGD